MKHKRYLILLVILFSILAPAFAPNAPAGYNYLAVSQRIAKKIYIQEEIAYQQALTRFKIALASRESDNNWQKYNPYGYIGKFQFGQAALESTGFGHVDFLDFMDNPSIFPERDQEIAMDSLLRFNEFILRNYIKEYMGSVILDSIKITKTGLLAASHLAGPANVKRFLQSNGSYNPSDRLGTHLSDYLFTFGEQFH